MFGIDDIIGAGLKIIDKVIPDPAQKAQAQLELQRLAQDGKLAELQADMNEANNISERWKADASSDSWLSKNIRPLTLIFILFVLKTNCMYDSDSKVVKLTSENFEEEVLESGYLWLVEFYAPW